MNRLLRLLIVCVPVAIAGCGGQVEPWGSVEGQVLLQGNPLSNATVLFSSDALGVHLSAPTDADGRFQLRSAQIGGVPVGQYRVAVMPQSPALPEPKNKVMFNSSPPRIESPIAHHYRNLSTTDLNADVQEGKNHFEFSLRAE